jgi:hypothetical protein
VGRLAALSPADLAALDAANRVLERIVAEPAPEAERGADGDVR